MVTGRRSQLFVAQFGPFATPSKYVFSFVNLNIRTYAEEEIAKRFPTEREWVYNFLDNFSTRPGPFKCAHFCMCCGARLAKKEHKNWQFKRAGAESKSYLKCSLVIIVPNYWVKPGFTFLHPKCCFEPLQLANPCISSPTGKNWSKSYLLDICWSFDRVPKTELFLLKIWQICGDAGAFLTTKI
jgi:hypothetical protein